ncbi:carbohydrate ABC transporter permease [Oceanispirochaeta sp. M2]|nr:carbohydrate ABC transporter permease [Oceanispirochaeta sp. M2]NPD72968.1 carbohydrate ABC transporter permease [Oceanispirochaeta sp. M1]RDG31311.1 carbohydrate ABC transporter permease [Oceanispirochaeta sp. M1]
MVLSRNHKIIDTGLYILLLIISLFTLYPFWYVLICSFNEGLDLSMGGVYLFPRKFSLENYRALIGDSRWVGAFFVSVGRTVLGTIGGVSFTAMVAYGLSPRNLVFKKLYFGIVILAMYTVRSIITFYILLRGLGLLNSFFVYIVPNLLDIFLLLIAVNFFREIPDELKESAYIDGANDLLIFFKIIVPVSKPLIATMALFIGVWQWNSWIDSSYFVRSESLRTMSYRMIEVINSSNMPQEATGSLYATSAQLYTSKSLQMAAIIITVVPIVLLYPFLQKHFVKGIMIGSVKG